jgi:hypothetical protein
MKYNELIQTKRKATRIAGFFYLIVFICGPFSLIVRLMLIIPGNPSQTALNILNNEGLFRLSIICDIISAISYLFIAFSLFIVFQSVDEKVSWIFVLINLLNVPIMSFNILNNLLALLILKNNNLSAFSLEQLQALAMLFLILYSYGYAIAAIFFGGWLFPLGFLVYKSTYFPKTLGILLEITASAYIIDFLTFFIFIDYKIVLSPFILVIAGFGEVVFSFYLFFKGINISTIEVPPKNTFSIKLI